MNTIIKRFILLSLLLLLSGCHSSPFKTQIRNGKLHSKNKYYALHVRFSQNLLTFFYRNGCNYNSVNSWTAYFSRDPNAYILPQNHLLDAPQIKTLPKRHTLKKISDLKLFLPKDSFLLEAIPFHSYPTITAERPRNYHLSRKKELQIAEINNPQLNKIEPGQQIKEKNLPGLTINNNKDLKTLPQVVDERGVRKTRRKPKKIKPQTFTLLQQAKTGPRYLNYILMSGVDEQGASSRVELWNLPLQLIDSTEPFQYLGELEIDLAPNINLNGKYLNYLGQVYFIFRVHNKLPYWEAYLDNYFRKKQKQQVRFTANLLQVVDIKKRSYPYGRLEYGNKQNCRL